MFNINANIQAHQGGAGQPVQNWEEMNRTWRKNEHEAPIQPPQQSHGMGGFGTGGMVPPMPMPVPVPFVGGHQLWGQGHPGFEAMTPFHQPPHHVPARQEAPELSRVRQARQAHSPRREEQSRIRRLERELEDLRRKYVDVSRESRDKDRTIRRLKKEKMEVVVENAQLIQYKYWWLQSQQSMGPSISTCHPPQCSSATHQQNDNGIIIDCVTAPQPMTTIPYEEALKKWTNWANGKKIEKELERINLNMFLFDEKVYGLAPRLVRKITNPYNLYRAHNLERSGPEDWSRMSDIEREPWRAPIQTLREWQAEQQALGLISPRTAEEVKLEKMNKVKVNTEPVP